MGQAFLLSSGRTLTVQNSGVANFASNFSSGSTTTNVIGNGARLATINSSAFLVIGSGGQLNVTAGGDVSAAGRITIGDSGTGTVVVDGAGSTLNSTSTSASSWGSENFAGGSANVTLRNGASASLPGGVHLGSPSTVDSDGVFNIESGAAATLGPLVLNASFADGATGTVNVNDTGSTLNVTSLALGNGTLMGDRGSASGGSATLNITDSAFLNVGAGGTTLNATATININGGNVSLGALTDNGGIINFNSGSLSYTGNLLVDDDGMLADGDLTLNDNHHLNLSGTTTIDPSSALILDGGTLITGALAANGRFVFNRGQLILNQAGTSVNAPIVTNTPSTTIVANANNISLGDPSSFTGFHHLGELDVGANTVTLNSASYARLGTLTTLSGGRINATNGIALPLGSNFVGNGTIAGRVVGELGSVIEANGPLSLGDAAALQGFNFAGDLRTRHHTVTLNSVSPAALGNWTSMGLVFSPGTLNAANGFVVDFGEVVTGFGTINSTNILAKRAVINGAVQGNSAAQPITLTGYIKGVGTFNHVNFTGTFDPGLSPTFMTVGSVSFAPASTLVMELGGLSRGNQYDAILASGALGLGGTLELDLINGFTPAAGNTFDIFDWNTISGTFAAINLPTLAGLEWDISQLYATGQISVVAPVFFTADFDEDGDVDGDDLGQWEGDFGVNGLSDADDDGDSDGADFLAWQRQLGSGAPPASEAAAAVPEPAGFVMAVAFAAGLAIRRPRRAR
jgi:hypothetical protein